MTEKNEPKKVKEPTIDRSFRNVIPALTSKEYAELETSIVKEGCRDPIMVWHGLIIDGHNRYDICKKHKIPFEMKELDFSSKRDALAWMITNQLGRRNLTVAQKVSLVLERDNLIRGTSTPEKLTRDKRKQIADEAGTSETTVSMTKKVLDEGSEETKAEMLQNKITIGKAHEKTTGKKRNMPTTDSEPSPSPKKPGTEPEPKKFEKKSAPENGDATEGEKTLITSRAGMPQIVIDLPLKEYKDKIGYYAIVKYSVTDEKAKEERAAPTPMSTDPLYLCPECGSEIKSEEALTKARNAEKCPKCGANFVGATE